jgi:DNA-binding transcriptional MerR regulator
MRHTTSSASIALGIPVRTLLAWEAKGAIGPFERDANNKRTLSEDDLVQIRTYAEGRRREQGRFPPEPRSTDAEDSAEGA